MRSGELNAPARAAEVELLKAWNCSSARGLPFPIDYGLLEEGLRAAESQEDLDRLRATWELAIKPLEAIPFQRTRATADLFLYYVFRPLAQGGLEGVPPREQKGPGFVPGRERAAMLDFWSRELHPLFAAGSETGDFKPFFAALLRGRATPGLQEAVLEAFGKPLPELLETAADAREREACHGNA